MREHHDGVEPDGRAEGGGDRLEQGQVREVDASGLVHAVKVEDDVGLVPPGEPLGVGHDLGVVGDVGGGGLEAGRVDEPEGHAVHLVLNHANLLGLRPERIRRGGVLSQQRVDRGGLAGAGLAQEQDGARETQVGVGPVVLLLSLGESDGAIKRSRRPSAGGRGGLLLAALELLGEL